MIECDCKEAKYAAVILNRMKAMDNIAILCKKCQTVWHIQTINEDKKT